MPRPDESASMSADAVEARLAELELELPALRRPSGNYVGWVRAGDLLFLSGQGAEPWFGRVGADMPLEVARRAARGCTLNLLAQAKDALGSLDRIARVVRVTGFIACTEDFTALPDVLNGASDLLIELFGEAGRHARAALGVQALPLGFAVEVEMVVQVHGREAA
jgi:enamine deaminase RidA (YjgF/YER057c/UK114 family)